MNFDVRSSTWVVLEQHIQEKLTQARQRLEDPTRRVEDYQADRGEIAAYRQILALPKTLAIQAQVGAPTEYASEGEFRY